MESKFKQHTIVYRDVMVNDVWREGKYTYSILAISPITAKAYYNINEETVHRDIYTIPIVDLLEDGVLIERNGKPV